MHESSSTQCSVEVVVRLQPPENSDIQMLNFQTLSCANKQYFFDYIFPHYAGQDQVYDKIGMKMIASAKKGYNSCIFAYGQTGSGKTYTMTGTDSQDGLIQKCLKGLFKMLQSFQSFELKLSYFQIYNEQVNDLLASNNGKRNKEKNIKIKQSLALGFYLENIQEIKVEGISDLIEQLQKGIKNRTTAETKMNRQSSRSHSILTLFINTRHKRQNTEGFSIKSSKMHFVDLAGSEKQKSTLAAGDRLKEASSINKSLTSLSIVIEKLSSKATHIPYRDSVLTKILRDSLGGNSKTILVATVSSKDQSIAQTISTLNFATKAKKVKLLARVNEEYDGSLLQLRRHIKQLECQIKQLKNKENENKCGTCQIMKNQYDNLSAKCSQLENQLKQKESKIQKYGELVQNIQKQHEYELAELMRRIQQTTIGLEDNDNYSRILTSLEMQNSQDRFQFNKEGINTDSYEQEPDRFMKSIYRPGLSVIMEQDTALEGSQMGIVASQQISSDCSTPYGQKRNHQTSRRQNDARNKIKKQKIKNSSSQDKNQLSIGGSSVSFEIAQLQIIKQLRQKNSMLQTELKIFKLECEHKQRENQMRLEQNRRIYEPIIKQWVEQNGSAIKNNLKAKNAVQQDLIFGLRKKVQVLKETIELNELKWNQKEKQYKNTIESIVKIQEQFRSLSKKKRNMIEIDEMVAERSSEYQNVSKSHPRLSGDKHHPQEIQYSHQNNDLRQNQNKHNLMKNIGLAPPFQSIQRLQQQLDRQELINQGLTRSLEDYKLSAERLEEQILQNRELAKFWENKCNNVVQIKKQIERDLYEAQIQKSNLMTEIEKRTNMEERIKLQNSSSAEQLMNQMKQRENDYWKKIEKLESDLMENHQVVKKLQEKLITQEQCLNLLKNQNYNYTTEIQNYRKNIESWKISCQKLEREKIEVEVLLGKTKLELERAIENNSYTVEKFERQRNDIKIEHGRLVTQNTNLFMDLAQSKDRCKLLGMKYKELKDINDRLKVQKDQLTLKNKDLYEFIEKDQSQSCRDIQKLNECNAQLIQKIQRAEQKQNYLISQFNNQREQTKFWKLQCEKQKKWAQDFKKMQEQFMTNQERERSRDKTGNINIRQNEKKKKVREKNQYVQNPLNSWEYTELKSQVYDIANKLSEICGIDVTQTNLVLKLDQIGQKINSFKILKEENKSLKAKNKLLAEQRTSQFWKKID